MYITELSRQIVNDIFIYHVALQRYSRNRMFKTYLNNFIAMHIDTNR